MVTWKPFKKNTPGFLLGCWMITSFFMPFHLHADDLEASRAVFADSLGKLNATEKLIDQELRGKYLLALERIREMYVQQGDLEQVLQVKSEKSWVETGAEPPALPEGTKPELTDMRITFFQAKKAALQESQEKKVRLANAYLSHLEALQKKRVQENDIDGAMACREESQKVKELIAKWQPAAPTVPAPVQPDTPPAEPQAGQVASYRWHPRENVMAGTLKTGAEEKQIKLVLEGKHQLSLKGLDARDGGVTLIPDLGQIISKACKESNGITFAIGFETDNLKQAGPARIVSLSNGHLLRNFTLGQQHNQLVLRFRTNQTDLNGTAPQVSLGELIRGRHTQVCITYSADGGLTCFRDGRKMNVQAIAGTLETWAPMGLFFGNESSKDRMWTGQIKGFTIRSEAVDDATAARLSRER